VIRIPSVGELDAFDQSAFVNYGTVIDFASRKMFSLLEAGLSDRVKAISVSCPVGQAWSIKEKFDVVSSFEDITVGIILHPENSLRQVEHGPSSEQTEEVAKFKELWGARSQMRRFQDGTIKETVVFDCDGTIEQRSILVARMAAFLLTRHFQVGEEDGVTYWAGLGNKYIKSPGAPIHFNSFQSVMGAYQEVTKEIKSLDLPLAIHRIHIKSDSLAYCSTFIPQPIEDRELVSRAHPPEFLIEFENSGKWPDDVNAIETMKRAFYIKIITLLEEAGSETKAFVGLGEGNESHLSLTHSSGHIFKVQIHHTRVGYLLQKAQKNRELDGATKHALIKFYDEYSLKYVNLPAHYNLISTLCLRYSFLGQTIRLAKRWIASHLLLAGANGIPSPVVEIMCVRIYNQPSAFGSPASGWTGFVRFLELLSSWRWGFEPLIVELEEGSLTAEKRDEIGLKFTTLAKGGVGHLSMFVATEMDPESKFWKSLAVPLKVVQRIVMLSREALSTIQDQLLHGTKNDVSVSASVSLL
jgi:U3 small nucleolar RNA-associated protein 22